MEQLAPITETMQTLNGSETVLVLSRTPLITCEMSTFAAMFGNGPYTYVSLSATPQASAGWQSYFDEWKAAGYIS